MTCRICSSATRTLLDLGESPPANSLKQSPDQPEESYPLVLEQCDRCGNVQLRDCVDARALYSQYLYMTPDSPSLTRHYTALEQHLTDRGAVGPEAAVLEIGSNTGMFLRHLQPRVRRVIGVDPAANICRIANASGIETVCDFFDAGSAATLKDRFGHPDLIVARHCFAHNRDPHEMLRGVTTLLDPQGHFLIENAYLLNTIENTEFDQIYHEHMFYYSIRSMQALLARHGMHIVDVLLVPVHGGSIVFLTKKAAPGDHFGVDREPAAHLHLRRHREGNHAPQLRRHYGRTDSLLRRQHADQARTLSAEVQHQSHFGRGCVAIPSGLFPSHCLELQGRDHRQGSPCGKQPLSIHRADSDRHGRVIRRLGLRPAVEGMPRHVPRQWGG